MPSVGVESSKLAEGRYFKTQENAIKEIEGKVNKTYFEGSGIGLPSKSSVAVNLPEIGSQELFTNLKAAKPESVSEILNTSPSQFTNTSFIKPRSFRFFPVFRRICSPPP